MYEGPAWHGPALLEVLAGVTADQAESRTIPGAHTIHELVAHLAAWLRIARERLTASSIRDHSDEENWPTTLPAWETSLTQLEAAEHDLEAAVLQFPLERLHDVAPATEPQTFYVLLHGVIQHGAYHAGQIALLKK